MNQSPQSTESSEPQSEIVSENPSLEDMPDLDKMSPEQIQELQKQFSSSFDVKKFMKYIKALKKKKDPRGKNIGKTKPTIEARAKKYHKVKKDQKLARRANRKG